MNDNTQLPVRAPISAGSPVAALVPRTYDEVGRVAAHFVKSGLAPRDMATVERVAIAIMAGMEVGLKPIAALNRIAIINNRPTIWGDAVPAIAIQTGQLVEWRETFTGAIEDGTLTAHCFVKRRFNSDLTIEREEMFSIGDAKRAGLWQTEAMVTRKDRNGNDYTKPNDSPWFRHPKRMLQMRARRAFRDLFSDALSGLYIAEELVGANTDSEMRDVTPRFQPVENPLGPDPDAIVPAKDIHGDAMEDTTEIIGVTVADDAPEHLTEAEITTIVDTPDSGIRETAMAEAAPEQPLGDKPSPAKPPRARRAVQGGYQAPEGGERPAPPTTGSGVVTPQTAAPDPDAVKPPPSPVRWGGEHYLTYVREWTQKAIAAHKSESYFRDRFKAETSLRNNLGTTLTAAERDKVGSILREAVLALRTVVA